MAKKINKSRVRYWLGQIHLWGGLGSGIVVLIISITGCLYVYEEEIRNFTQREYRRVKPEQTVKASAAFIRENLKTEFPGKDIEQLRLFADPSKPVIARLTDTPYPEKEGKSRKQAYFVHPYSGKLISRRDFEHDFMHYVEKMHKTLLLGEAGKWIIKVNIVIFLVMLLSGLYLWWPRSKNQRKPAFSLNLKGKFQIVNYSIHNTLGFYFFLPLLLITLTGIWWAVKPVQMWVYAAFGSEMKPKIKIDPALSGGETFTAEMAFDQVAAQYPGWVEAHINFARKPGDPVKVNLRYPYEVYKKHNVFEFDRYSGRLLYSELYADYSVADKIKHANRDLHTGQNYGVLGKLLAFFSSLFAASLPVTGFLIWYRRKYKGRSSYKKSNPPAVAVNRKKSQMPVRHPAGNAV